MADLRLEGSARQRSPTGEQSNVTPRTGRRSAISYQLCVRPLPSFRVRGGAYLAPVEGPFSRVEAGGCATQSQEGEAWHGTDETTAATAGACRATRGRAADSMAAATAWAATGAVPRAATAAST